MLRERFQLGWVWVTTLTAPLLILGCAHYPVNQPIAKSDPDSGYREGVAGTP